MCPSPSRSYSLMMLLISSLVGCTPHSRMAFARDYVRERYLEGDVAVALEVELVEYFADVLQLVLFEQPVQLHHLRII